MTLVLQYIVLSVFKIMFAIFITRRWVSIYSTRMHTHIYAFDLVGHEVIA
jgi:hypothetical protein